MADPTTATAPPVYRSTAHASLAALGVKLRQLDLFGPVRERVRIPQKTVRYTPADKLYDALIALLAGAHGLVEINRLLRADPALQAAFGRPACAEQSVVQDTLDACTAENVSQLEAALAAIYRQYGRGYRNDYAAAWQILDVDLSGLPCGKKAALATPGYFARPRTRQGRQLGRVLATRYHEVVVDRLFSGTTQLNTALLPLLLAAEETLALDETRRQGTLVRVDAGAGSVADINWVLFRGYHILAKDYSTKRARLLAESVAAWYDAHPVRGSLTHICSRRRQENTRPWRQKIRAAAENTGSPPSMLCHCSVQACVREALTGRGTTIPASQIGKSA